MLSFHDAVASARSLGNSPPEPSIARSIQSERRALTSVLLLTAIIYGIPWLWTSFEWKTGLPAIFAPDFYAYLNLANISRITHIIGYDPWYGVSIVPHFNHTTFRFAFVLFAGLRVVLRSLVLTSVLWSVGWSMLIAYSFWSLLRELLEDFSAFGLFLVTSLLVFVSVDALPLDLAVYLHPFDPAIRNLLPLPYVRMFFPQVVIPALLFYILNLKRAWESNHYKNYLWMLALQFCSFLLFPFATLFLALGTAIFIALNLPKEHLSPRVLRVLAIGVFSGLADTGYLSLFGVQPGGEKVTPPVGEILRFSWASFLHAIGGTVFLLVLCSALVLILHWKSVAGRITAALGLANVVMLFSDTVIDPSYLVSHHAGYFVQVSLGIEIAFLFWALRGVSSARILRVCSTGLAICFIGNGLLASRATAVSHLEVNNYLSRFASTAKAVHLTSTDLVIAPATYVDDVSATIPLISDAHVLFARNAEILLDATQTQTLQRQRQALFLYFCGRDSQWVEEALSEKSIPLSVLTLGNAFMVRDASRRTTVQEDVRQTLLPWMRTLERGNQSPLLRQYQRLVFLDDDRNPIFDQSRVDNMVTISESYSLNGVRVTIGRAR